MLEMIASQTSAIAVIAAGLTNSRPADFLPKSATWKGSPPRQDQTLAQQRDTLVALTEFMGGKIPDHVRARWKPEEEQV